LYNEKVDRLNYLESLVGQLSTEKIQQLQAENKALTAERDSLKGQVLQYSKTLAEVKAQADLRIQEAEKRHSDESARQRGVWENRVNDQQSDINRLTAENGKHKSEIESLKSKLQESETLRIEVEGKLNQELIKVELLEDTNSKVTEILEIVKGLAASGATSQEIKKTIDRMTTSVEDKEALVANVFSMKNQGIKGKEIGETLGIDEREVSRIYTGAKYRNISKRLGYIK
jgi:hypothetical protein